MTYIIAEIGQNHNGNPEIAKTLIHIARDAGVDAIKMTMRDLDFEMTDEVADSPYMSPNSYGQTYALHREFLEIPPEDIADLVQYAKEIGLDVIMTFCSHTLLDDPIIMRDILPYVNSIKVASRDITNTFLIERISQLEFPIILSSGMASFPEITLAAKRLFSSRVSLMHCVSKYPTPIEEASLVRMAIMQEHFSRYEIGYSDHTLGYEACVIAAAMGAKLIEKHITLDNQMRGSDHVCSLEPAELREMVSKICEVSEMKGTCTLMDDSPVSEDVKKKLMRSICSKYSIKKDTVLTEDLLCLLSPGDGIAPRYLNEVGGKITKVDIPQRAKIEWDMLC